MNASFTNALIGEAGVIVRAEKAGVNDLDHRMRPPVVQSELSSGSLSTNLGRACRKESGDLLWCDMDTWSNMLSVV